jgi:tetratricopeptide (TPR) repeat protein
VVRSCIEFKRASGPNENLPAIPLLKAAWDTANRKFGPEHDASLWPMLHLGEAYRRTGRHDRALPLEEDALRMARQTFGPNHPCLADFLVGLANCYRDSGRPGDAIPLLDEALDLTRKKLGPNHPNTTWIKGLLDQTTDRAR